MLDTKAPAPHALPPHAQLIQMAVGSWVSAVVYAVAKLGLADHLAAGAKNAAELAGSTGTHAPSLHRLMRTLAGPGHPDRTRGAAVCADSPGRGAQDRGTRLRALHSAGVLRSGLLARVGRARPIRLRTGETGFEKMVGVPLFDYLAQHPEEASHFSAAMVGYHGAEPPAVAAAYDFGRFGTIVDVGGATGNMLAAILSRHAAPRGVLFDRPHVVARLPRCCRPTALRPGHHGGGSFFERVPAGGDTYVLSHIIHDWNEDQCLTILGHCRKTMAPMAGC